MVNALSVLKRNRRKLENQLGGIHAFRSNLFLQKSISTIIVAAIQTAERHIE